MSQPLSTVVMTATSARGVERPFHLDTTRGIALMEGDLPLAEADAEDHLNRVC